MEAYASCIAGLTNSPRPYQRLILAKKLLAERERSRPNASLTSAVAFRREHGLIITRLLGLDVVSKGLHVEPPHLSVSAEWSNRRCFRSCSRISPVFRGEHAYRGRAADGDRLLWAFPTTLRILPIGRKIDGIGTVSTYRTLWTWKIL